MGENVNYDRSDLPDKIKSEQDFIFQVENGLIPVDIDLIKDLRLRGLSYEANKLLKTYHQNKLLNKKQLKNEIKRQDKRIKRLFLTEEEKEKIREDKRKWFKKKNDEKVLNKKCLMCNKSIPIPRITYCSDCVKERIKILNRIKSIKRYYKNKNLEEVKL